MALRDKAMLASLHMKSWGGTKLDRKVTGEVTSQYGASEKSGRWTTDLIPDGNLKALKAAQSALRLSFHKHSLPWTDHGS